MKIRTLLLMICFFVSPLVKAQKVKEANVPGPVKDAVAKKYPGAKVEEWEKEGDNFEAELEGLPEDISILLSPAGEVLETETEISMDKLPATAVSYLQKKSGGGKIKEISKKQKATGEISFEVEKGDEDLIFDKDGNFVRAEK